MFSLLISFLFLSLAYADVGSVVSGTGGNKVKVLSGLLKAVQYAEDPLAIQIVGDLETGETYFFTVKDLKLRLDSTGDLFTVGNGFLKWNGDNYAAIESDHSVSFIGNNADADWGWSIKGDKKSIVFVDDDDQKYKFTACSEADGYKVYMGGKIACQELSNIRIYDSDVDVIGENNKPQPQPQPEPEPQPQPVSSSQQNPPKELPSSSDPPLSGESTGTAKQAEDNGATTTTTATNEPNNDTTSASNGSVTPKSESPKTDETPNKTDESTTSPEPTDVAKDSSSSTESPTPSSTGVVDDVSVVESEHEDGEQTAKENTGDVVYVTVTVCDSTTCSESSYVSEDDVVIEEVTVVVTCSGDNLKDGCDVGTAVVTSTHYQVVEETLTVTLAPGQNVNAAEQQQQEPEGTVFAENPDSSIIAQLENNSNVVSTFVNLLITLFVSLFYMC
ncbi:hypothetical protein G210_3291 [Candida maltosa Xu316]|uniref:Hyphally-regulated cell wall protein N-terminal domain-containing protein n=1 Tax=Candida maltosa (strain Xu316) TaxID=1245528 RepID=M3JVQ0_CANMX|nr:hypothetical protein G210_3291 [Candida maltosa Xu316]